MIINCCGGGWGLPEGDDDGEDNTSGQSPDGEKAVVNINDLII